MATRSGGKSEDRANARSASGASASSQQNTSSSASGAARQSGRDASTTSTPKASTSTAGSGGGGGGVGGGTDRERELNKSRESSQRTGASARPGEVGQQGGAYTSPIYSTGANSPFAMMRRMMDDMDRLFSDFGFTHPGLLASGLLSPDVWYEQSRPRALSGETQSGSTRALTPQSRGQQALQRSGQRGLQTSALQSLWSPQVELFERGNNFVVRADLPGLSREDVDVEVDDDALVIRGQRRSDFEDEQEGYYRSERSYGSFYRAIPLPEGVEASSCNATFKDGVLEVTLPKPAPQASRAKKIDVK